MNALCKQNIVKKLALILGVSLIPASTLWADQGRNDEVSIKMFAPGKGDKVGIGGRGWMMDLAIEVQGDLTRAGFSQFQLTGPAAHNNAAPFPGNFAAGADDRLPGLIALLSTTTIGAGSCQNLADLFNLTAVTNITDEEVELWDSWIIGAPLFGVDTQSTAYVAMAADLNGDGVYNDAPAVVPDANHDGVCNAKDLRALGIASNIAKARFHINP